MKAKQFVFLTIIFLVVSFPAAGFCGEVNFGDKTPEVDEVIEALSLPTYPEGYKPRAIEKKSISMEINFEKNSFNIRADAKKNLDILSKALQTDRLADFQFVIEGHTDASGSAEYNQELSEKRSKSVKDYLVKKGVSPAKLYTIGKGESELLFENDPEAAANRRVRIVNQGN